MALLFLDPGALRTELSLQACATTTDGLGGYTESWSEIATVFALVEPLAADSRFGADQTLETVTHRITLRFRDDVASCMRFAKDARTFDILSVYDPDESGRYIVCKTREVGR